MFTTKNIVVVSLIATATASAWAYWKIITSEIGLMELYPGIDEKILIKAHRAMLKDILTGKLTIPSGDDDSTFENIFETHYLDPINSR